LLFQAAPLRLHPETLFCALHKGGSLLAVLKANLRLVLKAKRTIGTSMLSFIRYD
jgi:ABC-type uncharacterized transport system permease subunit